MATLSDGKPCKVRRLHFLEIEDNVDYNVDPPYTYVYETASGKQEAQYVLTDWSEPPEKPKEPFEKAQPDTELFALWEAYNLYQAVLLHEIKRSEQQQVYLVDVARYIKKSCLTPTDRKRIVTPEDYEAISLDALCPEVGMEDLERELALTFQG